MEGHNSNYKHPMEKASFISKIFVWWLNPFIALGSKKKLTIDDFDEMPNKMKAEPLGKLFNEKFSSTKSKASSLSFERLMIKVLIKCFWKDWLFAAFILIIWSLCMVASPIFLQAVITILTEPEEHESNPILGIKSEYGVISCLVGTLLFGALSGNYGFLRTIYAGTKARSAIMKAIYDKSLRLDPTVDKNNGEITTLMSNDSERIFLAFLMSHMLWIAPFVVICCIAVLCTESEVGIGPGFSALIILIIVFPLQISLAKAQGLNKKKMLEHTDSRVSLTSETLTGISMIKMSGWEDKILEQIHDKRIVEMNYGKKVLNLSVYNSALLFCVPSILMLVVLGFIILSNKNEKLSPATVYTVLAYVNIVRFPLTTLPRAIAAQAQAIIALGRIGKFLSLPEYKKLNCLKNDENEIENEIENEKKNINGEITITNGSFTWTHPDIKRDKNDHREAIVLKNINLNINHGELIAVVGKVASGKSSLLLALIQEIGMASGEIFMKDISNTKNEDMKLQTESSFSHIFDSKKNDNGSKSSINNSTIAYVSQEPWIQNCTVKENITFGSKNVNKNYFERSIKASALANDINVFPHGLNTEIGDRGINLSGGQRARIAIARAVYQALNENIPMILLDDVFSALDPEVGHNVFKSLLLDNLKDRTRIVALNSQLNLLHLFDRIIAIENGEIVLDQPAKLALENTILANVINLSSTCHTITDNDNNNNDNNNDNDDDLTTTTALGKNDDNCTDNNFEIDSLSKNEIKNTFDNEPLDNEPQIVDTTTLDDHKKKITTENSFENVDEKNNLYKLEEHKRGQVSFSLYKLWIQIGYPNSIFLSNVVGISIFIFFVGAQVFKLASEYWIGIWTSKEYSNKVGIGIYFALISIMGAFIISRGHLFMSMASKSSINFHKRIILSILQAPVNMYFDVTPAGRILNRISSDLDKVDSLLPQQLYQFLNNILQILSTFILCMIASPWFAVIFLPIIIIFFKVGKYFAKTSMQVKRIDSVSRSPLFSLFGETLSGLSTIRAFGQHKQLQIKISDLIDQNSSAFMIFYCSARWLALRLDMLIICLQGALAILSLFLKNENVDPNLIALALVYSLSLTGMLQFTVRLSVEVQNYFTSVERLDNLCKDIPKEKQICDGNEDNVKVAILVEHGINHDDDDETNNKNKKGSSIEFQNVSMRYRSNLPLVLNEVSFFVPAGKKIGVVGRTGSGKSSLLQVLFRMIHPGLDNGYILIDNQDISQIPLSKLRRDLGIIPQNPFLFSGTLRFNLDPWGLCTDEKIIETLHLVKLDSLLADGINNNPLDLQLITGGSNISIGQRQLIQICRTILQNPKIILADEMTSNVDSKNDALVQKLIKQLFKNQTMLTIAHRLASLVDSDLIAVMSYGQLAEFGSPEDLINNEDGKFYNMLQQSGLSPDIFCK